MYRIVLDRRGNSPLRDGFKPIRTEVEFLNHATGSYRLQIQGSICDWADSFFRGRGVSCLEVVHPATEIKLLCPALTDKQAEHILSLVGLKQFEILDRPLNIKDLLNAISPINLWSAEPSRKHAAEWLLWLIEFKPDESIQPLLQAVAESWARTCDEPENLAYKNFNKEMAMDFLSSWLNIGGEHPLQGLGNFPVNLPQVVIEKARNYWKIRLIETKGSFIEGKDSWPAHQALSKLLAKDSRQYFVRKPNELTKTRFDRIGEFLNWQEQQELQKQLPPSAMSKMPDDPENVLSWFRREYLPYRQWQMNTDDHNAHVFILECAKTFGVWFLEHYPQALSGDEMRRQLSFDKAVNLTKNSNQYVTLMVVLDGLHVGDAQTLRLKIQEKTPRLSMLSDEVVFTVLPTVTEFCKEALFRGVPPAQIRQARPIGTIIPEIEFPVAKIQSGRPGDIFLWRVQEPDHTYHSKNRHDALMRKVESELDSIANIINDIIDQVPDEIPLQLIITTDHGRLLGTSRRKYSVPAAMESHGRAAWGDQNDLTFGTSGYSIQDNLVHLDRERFGTSEFLVLPLDDDTFLMSDGKKGNDAFPHGGLFPEEVIIPWIDFIRDYSIPEIRITISGVGDAGKTGELKVSTINLSDIDVTLAAFEFNWGDRMESVVNAEYYCHKSESQEYSLTIEKWPTSAEIRKASCHITIKQLNGIKFSIGATFDMKSNEMYQSTNILEDLS